MESVSNLDEPLALLLPQNSETFSEIFGRIIRGEEAFSFAWLVNAGREAFIGEANELKYLFCTLLILGLISAVFHYCSDVFGNRRIAELSFYFTYLLLINTLLHCFYLSVDVASTLINAIVHFMEILMPTYYVTIAATSAFSTAAGFYQLTLIMLYAIQNMYPAVVLPLISTYVFGSVISGLAVEDKLKSMLSLIKKAIQFIIKLSIGISTGFGVVKSMVSPILDNLKITGLKKCIAVIPGIGDVTEAVSKAVLGSAVLIKNSLGVAILVSLITICISPLLKLLMLTVMLKVVSGLMGMFADDRSFQCTDRIGDACMLLLKTVSCVIAMLFITIAIVSAQTVGMS